MSTTTLPGWEDEEFLDWWPANPEHEREGGSADPGGVQSGPAPGPRQDEPSLGDELMVELGAPLRPKTRRRRTVRKTDKSERLQLDARQRLLLLDTWLRPKLPAKGFAALVGVSQHTLYKWKQRFEEEGPAGLANRPKGRLGESRLADPTKRAILMLKDAHPDWGQDRT